jgi:hypothetical protein
MRPNTVHAAFTPVPTICHGGHFYSSSTMQDSLAGIIHSFVDHIKITNTNHPSVASLLRYIARFYHSGLIELGVDAFSGEHRLCLLECYKLNVQPAPESFHIPRVETVDGALDLFSLCFLVIFGNVLDFRTYSTPDGHPLDNKNPHDVNGIAVDERYNMCNARGVCIELLNWWSSKYRLRHNGVRNMDSSSTTPTTPRYAKTYDSFPIIFLLEEAALLLEYKRRAQEENREGAPGCSTSSLHDQILNVVYVFGEDAVDHWENLVTVSSEFCIEQLSMGLHKEYLEVVELDPPQAFGKGQIFLTSVLKSNQPMWQNHVKIMSSLEPQDLILHLSSFRLNISEVEIREGVFFKLLFFWCNIV